MFTAGTQGTGVGTTIVTVVFNGIQLQSPRSADPASDVMWMLVGDYQHAMDNDVGALVHQPFPSETHRRHRFGWYAQIMQTM